MRCGLAVLLCFALCLSLSAREAPYAGYTTDLRAEPLPMPSTPSDELSDISSELRATADDLEKLFSALNGLLTEAEVSRTALDFSLAESMQSAQSGIDSIKDSMKLYRAQRLELWLWRGGTAIGIAGTIAAVIWGLSN